MNEDVNEFLDELATMIAAAASPALAYSSTPRELWINSSDDQSAAKNFAVLATYVGGKVPVVPVILLPVQCRATGETTRKVMALLGKILATLRDSSGKPLHMKTMTHYRINAIADLGAPFPLGIDDARRFTAAFNFSANFVKVS